MKSGINPVVAVIVIVIVLLVVVAIGVKVTSGKKGNVGNDPNKAKAGMMDATGGDMQPAKGKGPGAAAAGATKTDDSDDGS